MQTENPNILLVEDDENFAEELSGYLSSYGMSVVHVPTLETAMVHIARTPPHMIILDQFIGAADSLSVLRDIRDGFDGRIMILTGNSDQTDRIVGLELGADDFVSKLVSPREILARVRSQMRAKAAEPDNDPEPAVPAKSQGDGQWRLDLARRALFGPTGAEVHLTSMEFSLLSYLSTRQGQTISREELTRTVLNRNFDALDRSIDNLVSRLRKKFDEIDPGCAAVKSIRSQGYVFVGFGRVHASASDGGPEGDPPVDS